MEIKKEDIKDCEVVKILVEENGQKIGRAFLYLIKNDLHDRPYGLLEDLFVEEEYRGKGVGKKIFEAVVEEAKSRNCYKLISQSRYERQSVHEFYKRNDMTDYGKNFRINL